MPTEYHSRQLVKLSAEKVSNISSTEFPGHYPGEDHSWDLQKFKRVRKPLLTDRDLSERIARAASIC